MIFPLSLLIEIDATLRQIFACHIFGCRLRFRWLSPLALLFHDFDYDSIS